MVALADDLTLALDRAAFATGLGISPDPWQRDLLRSTSKRVIINASRQSGKSTTCAIIALHRILYHPNSLVLCLSPSLRQSQELYRKVHGFWRSLGRPVEAESETALSLTLKNGSRVISLPGHEGRLRGYSGVALLLVDEAAYVPESLFFEVRPMLSVSQGALVLLSTPRSPEGFYYDVWAKGGPEWERYQVSALDVPRIGEGFLAEERALLPDFVYRREYLCEFTAADDAVFRREVVEAAVTPGITALFGARSSKGAA